MRVNKTILVNKNPNIPKFVCFGGTAMPHDPDLVTVFLIWCDVSTSQASIVAFQQRKENTQLFTFRDL